MALEILEIDQLPFAPEFNGFRQNPPDKCLIAGESRCGVWFAPEAMLEDAYGVIGHYWAKDSQQSHQLLSTACNLLRESGCATVYGPMNGNTWKAYRFVTWSDGAAPFLMEPENPPEWPGYWLESGFVPRHEYMSTVVRDLAATDPRLVKARTRLMDAGVTWRTIDLSHFQEELTKVYDLSREAFSNNILYSAIDQSTFLEQYLPFVDHIDPRYVLLAHDSVDSCCGFVFAIPDLLQLKRGQPLSRLVIKTLAVSSKRRYGGLGAILVEEVQQAALTNGLDSAIHALMYSGNVSANIGRNSDLIRRYTLFAKTLS
ncbi:hypothetical protein JWJ90_00715 [Desulfobulbus rhabdoformis]|jgi:hypothetical protein|uniref:hypothetical protein n=1 Tax=Desulfobulbus rhabdoformis TaxID=34032 RepID=UPI001964BBE5|nr:hypothetical protein [Desulfobulbus rhabdoformis]MBM9612801.1 hypothetical protein [Desulfobulbus rhabdoformis]